MRPSRPEAFTLSELLCVMAIFAILAVIAVPNSLEARVRAMVARVRADQQKIAMGLEAYALDNANAYPPQNISNNGTIATAGWANAQRRLTTPVAYLATLIPDGFQLTPEQLSNNGFFLTGDYWIGGNPKADPAYNPLSRGDQHVMDYDQFNKNMTMDWQLRWQLSYGRSPWKLRSFGPLRDVNSWSWVSSGSQPAFPNTYYDASNGTLSRGLITRTRAWN